VNVLKVLGDPDRLKTVIDGLVASGNDITYIKRTQNNATYIIGYASSGGGDTCFLALEDGSFILLEDGSKILVEVCLGNYILMEDGSFLLLEDGSKILLEE